MLRSTLKDVFARLRLVYEEVRLNMDVAKQEIEDNATSRLPTPIVEKDKIAVVKNPQLDFPPQFRG